MCFELLTAVLSDFLPTLPSCTLLKTGGQTNCIIVYSSNLAAAMDKVSPDLEARERGGNALQ